MMKVQVLNAYREWNYLRTVQTDVSRWEEEELTQKEMLATIRSGRSISFLRDDFFLNRASWMPYLAIRFDDLSSLKRVASSKIAVEHAAFLYVDDTLPGVEPGFNVVFELEYPYDTLWHTKYAVKNLSRLMGGRRNQRLDYVLVGSPAAEAIEFGQVLSKEAVCFIEWGTKKPPTLVEMIEMSRKKIL